MLPTDRRKCTLTECWAVLTYSICPNKSVNRKCTWYWNNLGYTKKNTPVTFFSPSLTVQRWAPLGGIQGTKRGFFPFFPYFILCCMPIFWSLFTSCCSLYLPPLSASTSAQRRWGCCECTMLLFLQSCLFNEVKLFTSTEKYLNQMYIQRSGYGNVYYLFRFWLNTANRGELKL